MSIRNKKEHKRAFYLSHLPVCLQDGINILQFICVCYMHYTTCSKQLLQQTNCMLIHKGLNKLYDKILKYPEACNGVWEMGDD